MSSFDLIIIGGGILGSATAFFASRAGLRVALVEQRASLAAHTTSKAVSCFRAQWDDPDYFYLMSNSINLYENFSETVGLPDYDIGIHQQGWLFASAQADGPSRLRRWIAGQREEGVDDSEFLTGDEARARFPFLAPEVTAATFRARDGWLSPYEAAQGFVQASAAALLLNTRVAGITTQSNRVSGIETERERIFAPRVAVCAGPHSKTFATALGFELPVTLVRRQRAFIAAGSLIPSDAPMVANDDTGAYWRPETGGAFLGWAQEEEPQLPLDDVPADPEFAAVALEACARITPIWRQVAAQIRANQVKVAAGQYSITPDGKPLIGAAGQIEGLYFLTGDNGFGIEAGPQAARHLVRLILGELAESENAFRLDRPMRASKKLVL